MCPNGFCYFKAWNWWHLNFMHSVWHNLIMRHWIRLSLLCRCKWTRKFQVWYGNVSEQHLVLSKNKRYIVSTQEISCVYTSDSCVYTRNCLTVLCFAWQRSFACLTVLCFAWLSFALPECPCFAWLSFALPDCPFALLGGPRVLGRASLVLNT